MKSMSEYREIKKYIEACNQYSSILGLTAITELLKRLGNPQDSLKFIHLAGTNGKGSVLAYTSTILKEAGYRVGRYISPTIYSYRERIQVNEKYISREDLIRLTLQIKEVGDQMLQEGLAHPTTFEVETALAFLYFKEQHCDIIVLETGMGGLTDATNVVKTTVVSVLATIGMDHMGFLGNTLEEIATAKAGIIKPNTVVVSASQRTEVETVLRTEAQEKGCKYYQVEKEAIKDVHYGLEKQSFSYGEYSNIEISLAGSYQIINAVLALNVIETLGECGFPVEEKNLRAGFLKTVWKGRFTVLEKDPLFIVDGAHNPDGADQLKKTMELYFKDKEKILIVGVLADKDYEYVVKETVPMAKQVIAIMTPNNERALPAEDLAKTIAKYQPKVEVANSLKEAIVSAKKIAKKEDVIIAFGSLSYLGELTSNLLEGENKCEI